MKLERDDAPLGSGENPDYKIAQILKEKIGRFFNDGGIEAIVNDVKIALPGEFVNRLRMSLLAEGSVHLLGGAEGILFQHNGNLEVSRERVADLIRGFVIGLRLGTVGLKNPKKGRFDRPQEIPPHLLSLFFEKLQNRLISIFQEAIKDRIEVLRLTSSGRTTTLKILEGGKKD